MQWYDILVNNGITDFDNPANAGDGDEKEG